MPTSVTSSSNRTALLVPFGVLMTSELSFVADEPTWIGIVPVGYADGFRRGLTGTRVRVGGELCPVVGAISMDAFAVRLERELPTGTPVTLIGPGVLAEDHARVAGTITYELVCGVDSRPQRTRRTVVDG